jgi:hypothetical protein
MYKIYGGTYSRRGKYNQNVKKMRELKLKHLLLKTR